MIITFITPEWFSAGASGIEKMVYAVSKNKTVLSKK